MPELPEVETVRRGLEARATGLLLAAVEVAEPQLRVPVDERCLRALVGQEIAAVRRRAKYLLVDLDGGWTIVVHLGMSGSLVLGAADAPLHRHDHVRWRLEGPGSGAGAALELRFRDARRFGLVVPIRTAAQPRHALFARLGPEPFDDAFGAVSLRRRHRGSRRPVKNALMDQAVVTGVGNIYASEALWRAAVNPRTAARRIGTRRWGRIRDACRTVLAEAIEQGGTTVSDYRDASGRPGYFRVELAVYGREGESCRRCESSIRRIVQAGRSTYYCTGCQH